MIRHRAEIFIYRLTLFTVISLIIHVAALSKSIMIIITEINITQDSEFVKSFLRELFLLSSVIIIAEQKARLYMLCIGKGDVPRHVGRP